MVTAQVSDVPHDPYDQPAKVEPGSGSTVSVTTCGCAYVAEHVVGQLIPPMSLVMCPDPCPTSFTVSVREIAVKVAVADFAAFTENEHVVSTPEQFAPVHPVKVELASGAAVRVTFVPCTNELLQAPGHEMPDGVLETVPPPVPLVETVTGKVTCPNVAVTDCAAFITTMQVPVPLHPPVHPVKAEFAPGVAVSVTEVSLA
jgi:hypothetical protein